jgi:hypothetical protein
VAHTYNPSYSGGRGLRFKVNPGKKFTRLYLKKTHHKHRAGGVAQGAGPKFKPQNYQQQQQKKVMVGMVVHIYTLSYLESRDSENCSSRPA